MRILLCIVSSVNDLLYISIPTDIDDNNTDDVSPVIQALGLTTPQKIAEFNALFEDGKVTNIPALTTFLKHNGWTDAAITTMFARKDSGEYYFFSRANFNENNMTLEEFNSFAENQILRHEKFHETAPGILPPDFRAWYTYDKYDIMPSGTAQKTQVPQYDNPQNADQLASNIADYCKTVNLPDKEIILNMITRFIPPNRKETAPTHYCNNLNHIANSIMYNLFRRGNNNITAEQKEIILTALRSVFEELSQGIDPRLNTLRINTILK